MKRLDQRIQEVLSQNEKILCCVLPLGDPDLQTSKRLVELYLESGVDIVELMIPSQKPYFDSAQLHEACRRALRHEADYGVYLDFIAEVRQTYPEEPFEVMTYSDVVRTLGAERFVRGLDEADIEAHLLADSIAVDEDLLGELDANLVDASIIRVRFMPHPFREDLLPDIIEHGQGFMILQSVTDEEGKRPTVDPRNRERIERLRVAGVEAAVLLGYGIRDPERVREAVALDPDGIIVGSALMERIALEDYQGLADLIRGLKLATKPGG
ncbi:MAG: tryptophan synthase subunit alpha [Anaerolineales bacterium]